MEKEFWDKRWLDKQTGWDIGYPSPAIVDYFTKIKDKGLKILIPGCGNAYEAEFLNGLGFDNVWIIDISEHAVTSFKKRVPNFPLSNILCGDFFELVGEFDFVIEQTFFCAIHPGKREDYAEKMASLLKSNGILIGLLFNSPLDAGPPFGGGFDEYSALFKKRFKNVNIVKSDLSIAPRAGKEFWIELKGPIK